MTHRSGTVSNQVLLGLAVPDQLRRMAGHLLVHVFLLTMVAIVLAPFAWMLLTSVKDADAVFSNPLGLDPQDFNATENYARAFTAVPMARFMLNGMIVVFLILVVQLTTSILAAYALAKMTFRGSAVLMAGIMLALCVPIHVPAIPLFLGLAQLNLLDSFFALVFPWFLSAFGIFFFRQFFKSFPDEIIDAARLDGFTELEIVIRIVVPSAIPAIAAFSIFSITAHWNDLYWPLIVVTSTDYMTPPLGMMNFSDAEPITN